MAGGKMSSSLAALVVLVVLAISLVAVVDGRKWDGAEGEIAMVIETAEAEGVLEVTSHSVFHEHLGSGLAVAEFAAFALEYGKVYRTVDELRHRFNVFVSNVELIESTNRKGLSYKLGINKFADLTFDEIKAQYLGASQECSATVGNHVKKGSNAVLPKSVDWRLSGIVSPVKNQASCGSCWTFSTTGALESAHAKATGEMVLLSEQQLVDCAGAFNNFGCGGGLPSQAFEYIKYTGGLDTEESYPYYAVDKPCSYNANTIGARVADGVNITEGAEDELEDAVAFSRPVAVAFEVVSDFGFYKSGVYTSTNCRDKASTVNHAVLAVGYDVTEDGMPYWIIKNSWGASWGMDGYFNMEKGKNMCGVAVCASYPIVPEEL